MFCRNCEFWNCVGQWKGNCTLHPWRKPKWSQSAAACPDFKTTTPFHISSSYSDIGSGAGVSKPCSATDVKAIQKHIEATKAKLIIIDSLSIAAGGERKECSALGCRIPPSRVEPKGDSPQCITYNVVGYVEGF